MEFKKYSEIENSYRSKTIDEIIKQELDGGEWEVSLKIHGSHLALYYNGEEMKIAKRSGFIGNDNFYNVNEHLPTLLKYCEDLWRELVVIDCREFVIEGEWFGGSYPDIKSNVKAVQKGVFYSPNLHFYAYDLKINGLFQNTEDRISVFECSNIPQSPILFTGSFRECLEFNPEFEDPIYKDFGLPKVENNFAEGVVIKPCDPKFFGSGSRVILKNKNDKFKEREKKAKKAKVPEKLSPKLTEQINNIEEYITENRLRNVLSKIGEVTQKDFGKVIKEFNADIMNDYLKDYAEEFEKFEKADQKVLTKRANSISSNLLRENFLNIIDRVY